MTDNYEPTRKEIFKEMCSGLRMDNQKYEGLREGVNNFFHELRGFGLTTLWTATLGYNIPSVIRSDRDNRNLGRPPLERRYKNSTLISGITTGFTLGLFQCLYYLDNATSENGHPEVLLIPAATNVASGIYEIVRKSYKNAKKRLVERRGLEGRLE